MTTMDYTKTMRALRRLKVETGSLACLGCGYEHNCSTNGCAIIRNAVEHMEAALSNYDTLSSLVDQKDEEIKEHVDTLAYREESLAELGKRLAAAEKMRAELTDAQAVIVKEFEAKLEELAQVKAELDAAVADLESVGICDFCVNWISAGAQSICCKKGKCEWKWRGQKKEA